MDDATARALNRINRRFYAEQARAFSSTRESPWPGWRRLAERLEAEALTRAPAVLDVGCGNARFGRFLAERAPALRYTGVDASAALLAVARERGGLGPEPVLHELDLVEEDLPAWLGARRFDLIVLFGVLHHVPGGARRETLLRGLLAHLAPTGVLALTSWRLARFERFRARALPWEASPEPLDPAQLEPGDRLLPWDRGEGVRYVHFAHDEETAELVARTGARLVERYEADGRDEALNHYFLLRAPT